MSSLVGSRKTRGALGIAEVRANHGFSARISTRRRGALGSARKSRRESRSLSVTQGSLSGLSEWRLTVLGRDLTAPPHDSRYRRRSSAEAGPRPGRSSAWVAGTAGRPSVGELVVRAGVGGLFGQRTLWTWAVPGLARERGAGVRAQRFGQPPRQVGAPVVDVVADRRLRPFRGRTSLARAHQLVRLRRRASPRRDGQPTAGAISTTTANVGRSSSGPALSQTSLMVLLADGDGARTTSGRSMAASHESANSPRPRLNAPSRWRPRSLGSRAPDARPALGASRPCSASPSTSHGGP